MTRAVLNSNLENTVLTMTYVTEKVIKDLDFQGGNTVTSKKKTPPAGGNTVT